MTQFDPQRWAALIEGTGCPMCREPDDRLLLVELPSGRVLLQNDGDFPGYCILVHRRHVTELHELCEEEQQQLARDVAALSRAIAARCRPSKINYAVLGNEVPHLHCHVIPRYPEDGYWGKPIWSRPASRRPKLSMVDYEQLRAALKAEIEGRTEAEP